MPYPFQIVADGATARMNSPRITGPYENGSAIYVASINPGTEPDFIAYIEMYKSTDAGETWALQDGANSPVPYIDLDNTFNLTTFQDETDIVVIYLEGGGPVIGGTENARLCFQPFSMSSDTWGSRVSGGPTVYDLGVFPDGEPPGGWSGYFGAEWGGYVGLGLVGGCKRSSGEYVFVYDSHDEIHETVVDTSGYYYRRCSVVRYSGTWSSPVTLFAPVFGVTLREYFDPQVLLGDDDTVHIFVGSVGYLGESDPAYFTLESMWAHYTTLSASNVLGTEYVISEDLNYTYAWTSMGKAIRIDSLMYLPYRKSNGTMAVSEVEVVWVAPVETEVATLANALVCPLAVVIVQSGSTARLLWIDAEDTVTDQIIYSSVWSSSGVWGAPTEAFTLLGPSSDHGTELFTGLAMSAAIGLTLLYGASSFSFPLVYIQLTFVSVSSANRWYFH